jgi:hypothetical protein
MFSRSPEGKYYIEIPRPATDVIEYKITRGSWWKAECKSNGEDIDNRILNISEGHKVLIVIKGWKDL